MTALSLGLLLVIVLSPTLPLNGECINTPSNCGPGCYQHAGETTACGFACLARVCQPVGEGHYSLDDDNERRPCPRATYSNITEGATCNPCPSDTYNDQQGQAKCKACPSGTHTDGQIGQFSIMGCSPMPLPPTAIPTRTPSRSPITSQPSPSEAALTSSPDIVISSDVPSSEPSTSQTAVSAFPSCPPSIEPSVAPSNILPTPTDAISSHRPSFAPSADGESYLTPLPPSCHPSMELASISSTPSLGPSSLPSSSTSTPPSLDGTTYVCPVGYTGPSCEECCDATDIGKGHCGNDSSQYFFKNGRCSQCPSKSTSILIGIATLVVLISLVIAYREMLTRTPALFYIGLDYLQMMSFLGTASPFKWPRVVASTLSTISVFNFDVDATLSLECLINISYATKELLVLSVPVTALGVGIVFCLVIRRDSFTDKFASIAFGVLYFAYLQLTSSSFGAMVGSGSKLFTVVGTIAFKIYGISFPLLVGRSVFGREARREIKASVATIQTLAILDGMGNASSMNAVKRCWILYGPFQPARWYWSVVVLGRKLWLVCATFLWRGRPMVLGCILIFMFALSGVVNYVVRPYMVFSQEMAHLVQQRGLGGDKEDSNGVVAVEDTKSMYQYITMRRNVDLLLHVALCLMVAVGTASTRLIDGDSNGNDNDWKGELALSFGALLVVVSSIFLLIWSVWNEISHLGQFRSSHRRCDSIDNSPRTKMTGRLSSFSVGRTRGSMVVPSIEPSSSK